MKGPIAPALLMLLAPSHTFAQVNKCTDARGKPVFQEAPCDANREANRVKVSPSSGGFEPPPAAAPALQAGAPNPDAPDAPTPQKSQPKAANAAQAENRRYINGGMSRDDVIARIGAPDFSQVQTTWGTP